MKTFAKIVALGAALALGPVAHANSIGSGFSVNGQDNDALANYVGGSITFAGPGGETTSANGTGAFSALMGGTTIDFVTGFYLDAIPVSGEELFQFSLNGTTYTFDVTTYSIAVSTGTINLYGTLEETGAHDEAIKSYFSMANNDGMLGPYALSDFSGDFGFVPEPNSLLLMGTGLLAALAVMQRKRLNA
jgi:hypothetical protein